MKYLSSLFLTLIIPTISFAGFVYTAEFPSSSTPPATPPSNQTPTPSNSSQGGVVVVYGCTDPLATNYNKSATVKDASCVYASMTEQNTANTCTITFTRYQQLGSSGDEVVKIKNFLRTKEGYTLNTSKTYDLELFKAVKSFQEKYKPKVLSPWELLMPTGYWYKSTRKMANEILGCPEPAVLLDNGFLLR